MAPVTAFSDLARRAALHGGEIVREAGAGVSAQAKGLPGDWVTEVDVASERAIRELLHEATPDIPMQGEESGGATGDRYWVVDPLDGTTNFVHGFPAVGVSVALVEDGRPVAGCVHAPFLGDTYVAARGEGAWLERDDEAPVAPRGERPHPRPRGRRHRLPVPPQGLAPPLPRRDRRPPSRPSRTSAAPAPPASTWPGSPPASSTASSSSTSPPGTSPPAAS